MKHYTIPNNDLDGWLHNNRQEIHLLILEAIHEAQKRLDFVTIQIACIDAKDYTVNIDVKDEAEAIDALHKCLSYFVNTEQFEQAIIARNCLKHYTTFE